MVVHGVTSGTFVDKKIQRFEMLCCVPLCKNRSETTNLVFYSFPANEKERRAWLKLIRRINEDGTLWQPGPGARVCSWHFAKGRANGPCRFPWTESQLLHCDETPPTKMRTVADIEHEATRDSASIESASFAGPSKKAKVANSELFLLKNQIEELKNRRLDSVEDLESLPSLQFCFNKIRGSNEKVIMYTGLPTADAFDALAGLINRFELTYHSSCDVHSVSKIDQLLMTLMKLRMNLPNLDLAERFNCTEVVVSNVIYTFIYAIHEVLFVGIMMSKVSSVLKNQHSTPTSLESFSICRMTFDYTEIFIEKPSRMDKQSLVSSNCKSCTTFKGLVGAAPNGVITYASLLYCASGSDKAIPNQCNVTNHLIAGDLILADKKSSIHAVMPDDILLNIPSIANPSRQFSVEGTKAPRTLAKSTNVERAIERLKGFRILDCIPQSYRTISSKIFQVCCALTNFQTRILKL